MPSTPWPDEDVEQLKQLVADEACHSSADIAALMGRTRNSIIGKCLRLGLVLKNVSFRSPNYRPKAKKRGQHGGGLVAAISKRRFDPKAEATDDLALPDNESPCSVSILGLDSGKCAWPLGDPRDTALRYCGAAVMIREVRVHNFAELRPSSYCARHHRLAYIPLTARPRGRPPRSFNSFYEGTLT